MAGRRFTIALVLSMAAHAAVVVSVRVRAVRRERRAPIEAAESTWVGVELIDDVKEPPAAEPAAEPAAAAGGRRHEGAMGRSRGRRRRVATEGASRPGGGALTRDPGRGPDDRGAAPAHQKGQQPARPGAPGPGIDPARAAATIVRDPGPPPPPGPLEGPRPRHPPRPHPELTPAGGGRLRADKGPFVAEVARDGAVTFKDRAPVAVHVHIPTRRELGRAIEHWQRDPRGASLENGGGLPPIISGRFALNDMVMRWAGQDPYAARKLAFMDRTRPRRMRMAAAERSLDLRDAVTHTPRLLVRVWRGPGSARQRRRLLFQLWDECAETGPDEVVAAARAVRAAIVAFVRRELPAGSAQAYSEGELDALNQARTSRERFRPYRGARDRSQPAAPP